MGMVSNGAAFCDRGSSWMVVEGVVCGRCSDTPLLTMREFRVSLTQIEIWISPVGAKEILMMGLGFLKKGNGQEGARE